MGTLLTIITTLIIWSFVPITISLCPENTKTLHRIGKTRYFIIQNTEQRGDFVTIEQARLDCSKHGLKLATVKNLLSLAVVGRPLEKMVTDLRMKDTWYWLDAKYDMQTEKYHWGTDINDELKYTMILYRTPRPIGVSSHITFNNVYQKDQEKPQCLTLALPWLGSADHHINTTVFFGHQTSFDERDCKSQKKRHAMCEASKTDCPTNTSNPYILDEEKTNYFEEGNWIFGDRKHIVNWKQRTFNDSERYCKSLGLQLMNAGDLEKFLIPHIKMWSREITASQFWTGMSYHEETKQYMDSSGNIIPDANTENNFTESEFQSRSSKNSTIFCVALSLAYEFKTQMPCSNNASPGCQWSFIRYAPANCNNYHGTICQHPDYDEREIKWYPNFKTNLNDVLEKTALTTEFGYKGNNFILRSKYKQTFGVCYCPKGYRLIRSQNKSNLAWSVKPINTTGKEIYDYDYTESYWMVDKDLYNKNISSKCTVSFSDKGTRKFKEIECGEWHFYLCERLGRRPTRPSLIAVNKAPAMEWKEGEQPRVYPLVSAKHPVYDFLCPCKLEYDRTEWNTVTNECLDRWEECPSNMFNTTHCQRGGSHVFYSIGGIICNSQKQNDRCTFEKVIRATCFHRKSTEKDSKGITYEPDPKTEQPWGLTNHLWNGHFLNYSTLSVPIRDLEVYISTQVGWFENLPSGNPKEKDGCATRSFTITGDGRYEISIKFADHKYKNSSIVSQYKRAFNILLNDIYIAREFNPNDYRPIRHGVELNVNIRVFENGKMLELQGHPSKVLEEQKLKLEMCYSYCARTGYKADPNWMMTAVSVIKFASKPDDPCECKLKNSKKEYQTVTNQCIDNLEIGGCSSLHFSLNDKFCQRKGGHIFYAIHGAVCNSLIANDYCYINMTMYGVNFGGDPHKDDRYILHDKMKNSDWQFKNEHLIKGSTKANVKNVPESYVEIYREYAGGKWNFARNRSVDTGCAVLLFQTYGEGYYEISMKTGEVYYNATQNKNRTFSVVLNDIYIVKEFVMERYRESPNGIELVANFKTFYTQEGYGRSFMLELQGHPPIKVQRSDQKLQFELCHSNCKPKNFEIFRNWIMYGLSIIRFKRVY